MSTVALAARGTFQPPAWSASTAPSTRRRPASSAWRSTPPDPIRVVTLARGRGDSVGWAGRACRRTATRAASRASSRSRARSASSTGSEAGRSWTRTAYARSVVGGRGTRRAGARASAASDDVHGVPAHAEIALDGAGVPERCDDVLAQGGVLTLRRQARVDVGRRTADVDDEHVTTAREPSEHLDAAQHDVGGGRLHHRPEGRVTREPLAADHVAQEGRPDRRTRRLRCDDADLRQHVVGQHDRAPGRPEQRAASSRASTLPATTTGTAWSPWPPIAALARRAALCSKTSALPPSVPPTRSTMSGRAARTAAVSAVLSSPAATWTTLAPAESPTR